MTPSIRVALSVLLMSASACLHAASAPQKTAEEMQLTEQMQSLQSIIGDGKRAFVEQQLQLNDVEAEKFWPVYESHQAALSKLNLRRLDNILAYARVWNDESMDDAAAIRLATEAIAIDKEEAALMDHTFRKLKRVVPAVKMIRYLQLESKLRAIVRFDQAAQVPFVQQ